MRIAIIILILLCAVTTGYAQNSNNPCKVDQQQLAAMEKEFYNQPPFVNISLFINDKEAILDKDYSLTLLSNSLELHPTAVEGAKFLFPAMTEPFSIILKKDGQQFRFDNLSADFLKHGAEMVFGVITKLDMLQTDEEFNTAADYNSTKKSAYHEGRWQVSQEKFINSLDKNKTENVTFFVLIPRTFGDGVTQTSIIVNLKHK